MRRALGVVLLAACGGPELMPAMMEPPKTVADGLVDPWVTERPLPVARANHCAVAFADQLLVAGGNYKPEGAADFVTLDDVQVAKVGADGSLAEWRAAGRLPSAGVDCVLAVEGRTLVLLGGLFTDSALNGRVWKTTLAEDGTFGEWSELGTLPYGRRTLGGVATLRGGKLWLNDARLPSEGEAEAVLATATLDSMQWTTTQYAKSFRGKPQVAFTGDTAFVLGGYGDGNAVLPSATAIGLSGAVPAETTPMPEGRTFGAAVAADGWVFVTGGRTQIFGVQPVAAVWSVKANGAGLGEWKEQAVMPEARSNHAATVVGDWLIVTGGGAGAGGLDTVFRARVKRLPPAQ